MEYMDVIKQAGAKYETGTLEHGCGELLLKLAEESASWAELIAQDLSVGDMDIKAFAKDLVNYARQHKKGDCYAMTDAVARERAMAFYSLPNMATVKRATKKDWTNIDLLDVL